MRHGDDACPWYRGMRPRLGLISRRPRNDLDPGDHATAQPVAVGSGRRPVMKPHASAASIKARPVSSRPHTGSLGAQDLVAEMRLRSSAAEVALDYAHGRCSASIPASLMRRARYRLELDHHPGRCPSGPCLDVDRNSAGLYDTPAEFTECGLIGKGLGMGFFTERTRESLCHTLSMCKASHASIRHASAPSLIPAPCVANSAARGDWPSAERHVTEDIVASCACH